MFLCGTRSLHHHFSRQISPYNRISIRFVPRFLRHSKHKIIRAQTVQQFVIKRQTIG
jgi:hypothetical protein